MTYEVAVVLGTLLALMSDPIVLVPGLLLGALASTWQLRAVGFAVILAGVVMIKAPMIERMAHILDIPLRPLPQIAAEYAAALIVVSSVAAGLRWIVRRAL